jgi:hypothetical protein
MLPMLTIPAAVGWTAIRHRATRASAAAALAATTFASCVLVFAGGGRLAYNSRETFAAWLEWLNGAADLAHGLPAWWRGSETILYRDTAIWACAFAAAWGALRAVEGTRWLRTRGALAAATSAAYAVAAMCAIASVWTLAGASGSLAASGQIELLRRISAQSRVLAIELPSLSRLAVADVPQRLRIVPDRSTAPGGAGPNDRPLYQIASVPAGQYRLRPSGSGAAGWLMVGIGRDQFSVQTGSLAAPPEPIILNFPVDVRAIVVRGDELARRSISVLTIEPLLIAGPAAHLTDSPAKRAVRYPAATVFFLDDRSFPEPEAFWIGGERTSSIVLQPNVRKSAASILVRNAPVSNHLRIQSGAWHSDVQLGPGEECRMDVPLDAQRDATLLTLTSSAGFRPSDVDSKSRDHRFLGVWLKIQ